MLVQRGAISEKIKGGRERKGFELQKVQKQS